MNAVINMTRDELVSFLMWRSAGEGEGFADCYLCGQDLWPEGQDGWGDPAAVHIDHIVPKASEGLNLLDNLALTHPQCNEAKGSLPLGEYLVQRAMARTGIGQGHDVDAWRTTILEQRPHQRPDLLDVLNAFWLNQKVTVDGSVITIGGRDA